MKRDMELIRQILLAVENEAGEFAPYPITVEGFTSQQIAYHSRLLIEVGFARGQVTIERNSDSCHAVIESLTWEGHEFLDAARPDTRWKTVMATLAEKGETVTIEVLQGLLVAAMKTAVGLA